MSHSLDSGISNNGELRQQKHVDPMHFPSKANSAHYDTPANIAVQSREMAIRHGFLEKCKIAENGVKLKKPEWFSSYAYLFTGHLLFYKDQKSAEVLFYKIILQIGNGRGLN